MFHFQLIALGARIPDPFYVLSVLDAPPASLSMPPHIVKPIFGVRSLSRFQQFAMADKLLALLQQLR